jgi:SPP1 gp7 family putative phage head morphogenesis protein
MTKKNKIERRYLAVSRILRSRNYGFKKIISKYQALIFKSSYRKGEVDQMARDMYNNLTAKESLSDLFDKANQRIDKTFKDIESIIRALLLQGSSKVFDARGNILKLGIPNYEKTIQRLTTNNLNLVKGISEDQRKVILDEISKGVKKGKSYAQMSDQIHSRVETISKSRASLIANTESHKAHSEAMERTMVHNGIKKYQWLSANDARVAPLDESLHRQVFEFGKKGTMDWKGTDGKTYKIAKSPRPIHDTHPRCRCVIVSVLD